MTSLFNIHGGDIRVVPTHLFFFCRASNFCQSEFFFYIFGEKFEYTVYLFRRQTMTLHFHLCENVIYTLSCVSLSSLAAAAKSARGGRVGPYTIRLGLRPHRPLPWSPLSLSPPLDLLTVLPLGLMTDRSPRKRLPFPLPLTTGMSSASEMGGDSEEGELLLEYSEIWWKQKLILKPIFK